jgi:ABC-type transport system involved in multi-copper enzyme maturation permease subunit
LFASGPLPFATLALERPPLQPSQFLTYLAQYAQDGGGFAALGLSLWVLFVISRAMTPEGQRARIAIPIGILLGLGVSLLLFAGGGVLMFIEWRQTMNQPALPPGAPRPVTAIHRWQEILFTAGGAVALMGLFVPFFLDALRLRGRRIGAIAKLSFLEVIRSRVIWVFLVLVLIFLFPPIWFFKIKPEDELRSKVSAIYWIMTPFFLMAATVLAAFRLPTDIRTQTIHTIVTKPVERFEIVLGRFVGYLTFLTIILVVVVFFSLLLIGTSGVDPLARQESMTARVPVYGDLGFMGPPGSQFAGESVGREWEFRRYIPGGPRNPFRAVWVFNDLDRRLTRRESVPCEFSFDIFRTTKGEEGKGVFCTFMVASYHVMNDLTGIESKYEAAIKGLNPNAQPGVPSEKADWEKIEQVAGELGYYEFRNKEVVDYHTQSITIPVSVVKKAFEGTPPGTSARLFVLVRCESRTQFLGVAKPDLYLLAAEGNFYLNFVKGAAGVWLRMALVIGIAIACSTYLNGIISFLVTFFLVGLGFLQELISSIAYGSSESGDPGPTHSLKKLVTNESLSIGIDKSDPTGRVMQGFDEVFRWFMRRILNVVPDMDRLTWSSYVAEGFNVPNGELGLNLLFVLAYLLLWGVLAHYLIKWREIATW